ncbi:MAG: hypothetical protein IIC53_11380 [Proteobacteria bacterium]|nr:hypothetical protein [Pseudomonadota bacterium]MCH8951414.1 hypothetical protein [Pseudomonadota bacterium]
MKTVIAALVAVLPSIAAAEGFTTLDLGSIPTDEACLARAEATFEKFGRKIDVGEIVGATWSISAFDIGSDDYDAHIVCAYGPDDQTQVTLIVYYSDNGDEDIAGDYGARLKLVWKSLN